MAREINLFAQLFLLLAFSSKGLYSQKLIIDTFTYTSYGVYCESVMVCECLVPDSTFSRINGRLPDEETQGALKYQKYCYNLGYDKDLNLYSFKDFEFQIGNKGFEFSYPQYLYSISKRSLLENLKNVNLFSYKTQENFEVKILYLSIDSGLKKQFNIPDDEVALNKFLESIDKRSSVLKIEIEPIEYPVNEEECGNIIVYFPRIEFSLR